MEEVLNIIQELWKPIINYEGLYEVSNYSRVKRLAGYRCKKDRILKFRATNNGHLYIRLCKNGILKNYYIYRLALEAFVSPCPRGKEGCHNNGNPSDNFIGNLRWDTRKANIQDSKIHGTFFTGKRDWLIHRILDDAKAMEIKKLAIEGVLTQREIAKIFNISHGHVSRIKRGESWR